jgi:predicted transcriptional regulator
MATVKRGQGVSVFVRLPGPLAERVRQLAKADERSVSAVVRRMVLKAVDAMEATPKTA